MKSGAFESPYQVPSRASLTFCGESLVGQGAEKVSLRLFQNPTFIGSTKTEVKSESEPFSATSEVQAIVHSRTNDNELKESIKLIMGVAGSD